MEFQGVSYTAQEDVKDCLCRLGIGADLSKEFGLLKVQVGFLRRAMGGDLPAELRDRPDKESVQPRLSVLPMCFSWVFWVAQQVHPHIAIRTLGPGGLIVDRSPPPRIAASSDTALSVYADNANQFGLDPDIVNQRRENLSIALSGRGLDTHEIVDATTLAETLGI